MKNLIIILTLFLFTPLLFGQSKENCYVVVESSEEFNSTFLTNISASIISQFLKEVEPIPPEGIGRESCLYQVSVSKQQDTTFVTFKGKNLNSYGDSKLSGTDGFQQSLLKSLFRALTNKRHSICEGYGELLEQCENIEVETDQTEIYSVSKDTNKQKGILFDIGVDEWKWIENGDEKKNCKYVGEVAKGKPNGLGVATCPDGYRYKGEWKIGEPNGQGSQTWSDGENYVGEFKYGQFHGQGKLTYGKGEWEGDKYVGEFKEGLRDGQGTYYYNDGGKYSGEFKDGKYHGQGIFKFANGEWEGDEYVGEFKEGLRDGQGTYYYNNGDKYVGDWKDGALHGQGTWYFPNGDKWVGEMRNNRDWNTTGYDTNGNIIGRFVKGVRQ